MLVISARVISAGGSTRHIKTCECPEPLLPLLLAVAITYCIVQSLHEHVTIQAHRVILHSEGETGSGPLR